MITTPITSITDELLTEIEAAFLAGWNESGEGYNAEYPCTAKAEALIKANAKDFAARCKSVERLRLEVEALKTDLKTSRADEMQAMRWLTEMRFASGDDGKLMLPDIVAHIEALRGDKELLDWLADPENEVGNVQLPTKCVIDNLGSLRDAIRQAMQSNTEGK
jgi:hypothetical protein